MNEKSRCCMWMFTFLPAFTSRNVWISSHRSGQSCFFGVLFPVDVTVDSSRHNRWGNLSPLKAPRPTATAPLFSGVTLTGKRRRPSQVNHRRTLSKASRRRGPRRCWCPTHLAMTARSKSRSGGRSQRLLVMEPCYWFVLLVLTVHSNSLLNSHNVVGSSISRLKVELINNQVSHRWTTVWFLPDLMIFLFTAPTSTTASTTAQPTSVLLRQ